jgi:Dolichyl-phosphate-mannose-protein mannosyltransferase
MLSDKIFSGKTVSVFCFFVFLVYLIYRIMLLFFPHPDTGGVEVNIIYFVQRILDNQPLYTDPETAPYAIAQYSPFYYYLVAGVARLSGIGADDVFSLFITGRIVSLVLNVAYLGVIILICRNIYAVSLRKSLVVAFAAFIFLQITSFARPDSLYHFFFMLTVYFLLKMAKSEEEKRSHTKAIVAAALLAAITLFSKQTGFFLPAIAGLWLLYRRQFKSLLLFSAVYLAAAAFLIAGAGYFLAGQLLFKNAVLGINNGISISWYRDVIINPFYNGFGLVLLPAFLGILFITPKDRGAISKFSGFMLFTIFICQNLVALKVGSIPGYFTEWWTFLFILLAYYWPSITKVISGLDIRIPGMIVVVVLLLKLLLIATPFIEKMRASRLSSAVAMQQYNKEKAVANLVKGKLSPTDKFVVFTNLYTPDSYLSNFLFRQAVMPQMEIVILSTYPRKKFDYSDFIDRITTGKISWLLMRSQNKQKQFFDIQLDQYQLTDSLNGFHLYQFKP